MLADPNAVGGGVPLSQNPYARRQLGLSPQLDPRLVAMLVKAGVHVAGVNDRQSGGMVQRAPRTAQPVGAPHLRTAQHAAPVDLSAMGAGMTAIPGPSLEGGPVAPPGMPPAAPQPVEGQDQFAQQMAQLAHQNGALMGQQSALMGQQQRLGQLGRHNAIAAQLVKRLMLHRMVGRLAQPAVAPQSVPGPVGGHVAY